jgi:2',3'-cyclic-nucleotide 2'-phosphodiesterase
MSTYKILFLGDVVGRPGRQAVAAAVPSLLDQHQPLFLIINGENAAAGHGITPDIIQEFLKLGADAITLGNHAFNKREVVQAFQAGLPIVRPINMPAGTPGPGTLTIQKDNIALEITNACGRVFLDGYDDPFAALDHVAKKVGPHWFVDFHGEATSEKVAMGWHLDGRASVVVGTHTHVQTADNRVLHEGTAYITDVGMCGPMDGVIGMDRDIVLTKFRTSMPARFEVAPGRTAVRGIVAEIDRETGRAYEIDRISFET